MSKTVRFGKITGVFFETAVTPGQTQFDIEVSPTDIICLFINGAAQNQTKGDFSLAGSIITLNSGVDVDDEIFGTYIV